MEHNETLAIVRNLVESDAPATASISKASEVATDTLYGDSDAASREELETLMSDVKQSLTDLDDPRINDPRIWRRLLREMQK
jgi:hypothetical protein